MSALFKYGPNRRMVKLSVALSWPLMQAAKRLSNVPLLKWVINPFFAHPHNEITAIPINAEIAMPDSVALPSRILEEVLKRSSDIFVLDECICRGLLKCTNHPKDIGCIALGPAARRMHPSHGRFVTVDEGMAHVRRAAKAGLIASVAHVWIDPVAFWTVPFSRLMFICFCDDCCCLYRTHMKHRGPNLDRAYKGLPGISVSVDPEQVRRVRDLRRALLYRGDEDCRRRGGGAGKLQGVRPVRRGLPEGGAASRDGRYGNARIPDDGTDRGGCRYRKGIIR